MDDDRGSAEEQKKRKVDNKEAEEMRTRHKGNYAFAAQKQVAGPSTPRGPPAPPKRDGVCTRVCYGLWACPRLGSQFPILIARKHHLVQRDANK